MKVYNFLGITGARILMSLVTLMVIFHLAGTLCSGQSSKHELPMEKKTTLGLYVTSKQAYEKWKAAPDKIKILDVRTTEEYLFVGHAAMAWNIPLLVQIYQYDADKKRFPMKPNPDFISRVKEIASNSDTILVTCRSGGRSAMAVNQLAEAGFKNAYNITDGVEGDIIDDPESVFFGQRLKNGWKNSGIPWTYEVVPEKIVLPDVR